MQTETVSQGTYRPLASGKFGKPVAVAVLEVLNGDFAAEVKVLIQLSRHPHLVRYYGCLVAGNVHQIITELAPLGSLQDAMEQIEDDIQPRHQLAMTRQICGGMEALAAEGMVHRVRQT